MHITFKRLAKLAGVKINEELDENKLNDEIIKLFSEKKPSENDVHELAKTLGISAEAIETEIYKLLYSFLKKLGKHKSIPDSDFDPQELEMGRKVELEHTDNKWIAELIAKDHLSEPGMEHYYTLLKKVEKHPEK